MVGARRDRGGKPRIGRARIEAASLPQRRRKRRGAVASPIGEQDQDQIVRPAQARCDAGVQERALADAALAEEEREPGSKHVRDDELCVGITTEEVGRILLLVARESLVRGLPTSAPRPRSRLDFREQRAERGVERRDVVIERHIEDVDATQLPELAIELGRAELNGPRLVLQLLLAPDSMQDHPQVPVAHAVAQEEKMAAAELRRESDGDEVGDVRACQDSM
jgi:hypothetical protein